MKYESDGESNSDSNEIDGPNIKADFIMDGVQTIESMR